MGNASGSCGNTLYVCRCCELDKGRRMQLDASSPSRFPAHFEQKRQYLKEHRADHNARILLTSDGLSNGYLIQAFLGLFGTTEIPTTKKALILTDSQIFRDASHKPESFKEQLISFKWPEKNITTMNLIDKVFIPPEDKKHYMDLVNEARALNSKLVKGESVGTVNNPIVERLKQESLRLNEVYKDKLACFLKELERYDVVLGDGGDVVILNFALKINPTVTKKLKELIRTGATAYVGRSAGAMVASKTMRLSGEVTDSFLELFLGGDPKGELQVFNAPIAFRPHYNDKAWGAKVKEENSDLTDEGGVVFVPVKNGEGIIMQVNKTGHEDFKAVIRQNTIIDEMEHVLNYLPRANFAEKPVSRHNFIGETKANHKARILLTSDGLSNEYLDKAFLRLFGDNVEKFPQDKKALVLMDSSIFRDPSVKMENFKDQLVQKGWPIENIRSINLIEKVFVPDSAKQEYMRQVADARALNARLVAGECLGTEVHPIVESLRQESLRLNNLHRDSLDRFLKELDSYDVILGNGGDVVIANFALKINPEVTAKIKNLIGSGRTAYVGRSAGSMVATKTMRLSGEVNPDFLHCFLGGDPKGELQVFNTPVAFRPHYNDEAWGAKVKAENEDTTDEGGCVFVPVKNGEGVIVQVTQDGKEDIKAVIRQNTIIDEMEHILNYLPRFE